MSIPTGLPLTSGDTNGASPCGTPAVMVPAVANP
jgi:hypothetical protein